MNNENDMQDIFSPTGGDDYMKNFAIMIPMGPFKELIKPKIPRWKKVFCFFIGHRWGTAGISWHGSGAPRLCKRCGKFKWFDKLPNYKWIDRMLRPLCYIGLHRWKPTYEYSSYSFGPGAESKPLTREQHYSCTRCRKNKTKTL